MRSFGICVLMVLAIFCGKSLAALSEVEKSQLHDLVQSALNDRSVFVQQTLDDTETSSIVRLWFESVEKSGDGVISGTELSTYWNKIKGNKYDAKTAIAAIKRIEKLAGTVPNGALNFEEAKEFVFNAKIEQRMSRIAQLLTGKDK